MAGAATCPLDPSLVPSMKWTLRDLEKIEKHLSTDTTCQHPPLKELVLTGPLDGCTPLLMACSKGELSAVRHIIEVWKVDVHAAATYIFSSPNMVTQFIGNLIKGCTPLFVAASESHSKIAQYLIDKGADVSARTSADNKDQFAGLTPLHGSVLMATLLHLFPSTTCYRSIEKMREIKRERETDEKKLNVIRILANAGADLSAVSYFGTPIWNMGFGEYESCAIEIPSFTMAWCSEKVITLLLELGMDLNLRSPWLGRTVLHHWTGKFLWAQPSDILSSIDLLIKKGADIHALDHDNLTPMLTASIGNSRFPNCEIFNFFLNDTKIDTKAKIEAIELAAASLLSYEDNWHNVEYAFQWLTLAQNLRVKEGWFLPPPSTSYGVEWITSASKEEINQRRPEWVIQAILVRLRILSSRSWGAVQHYLWRFIDKIFNTENQLELAWIMLKTISKSNPRFDPEEQFLWATTVRVVRKLVDALSHLQKKNDPLLNLQTIETSVELVLETDQSNFKTEDFNKRKMDHLQTLVKLFSVLAALPDDVVNDELKSSLHKIVTRKGRSEDGKTLLHAACVAPGTDTSSTVQFLLDLGAHHDEVDNNKNGALHYLAQRLDNEEEVDTTALLLLKAGTHLDRVNKERKTAADILFTARNLKEKSDLPDWCRGVPNLSCLSARVLGELQVPYDPAELSLEQNSFVEMH